MFESAVGSSIIRHCLLVITFHFNQRNSLTRRVVVGRFDCGEAW